METDADPVHFASIRFVTKRGLPSRDSYAGVLAAFRPANSEASDRGNLRGRHRKLTETDGS